MTIINPLDVFFWTFRRNERDVVNLYNVLSPVMQLATGGSMLNFGYWSSKHTDPVSAQIHLCSHFGELAELSSGDLAVDVGSGLSAPSKFWRDHYTNLKLYCVNINFNQLRFVGLEKDIEFLNSTSTALPFTTSSVDRVLALESAQHFKPLPKFISESKRILKKNGILTLAVPVVNDHVSLGATNLLKYTWSSEHYEINYFKSLINDEGFKISEVEMIGSHVYDPLANFYVQNRSSIKKSILKQYPSYLESILFKSLKKMKEASEKKLIDYILLKCKL